jgi:uncharacterized protein involved in outer membrane biogenesis
VRTILKVLVSLVLVAVVAVAGLAVFVRVKYPPERLKALANEQVEKHLHRQMKLESVRLNLFQGLSLEGFQLSERPSFDQGIFVASRRLAVKPYLLPLFKGQVIVKSVELAEPEIHIVRRADGTFNFSDLAGSTDTAAASGPDAKEGPMAGVQVLVHRLAIQDGQASFEDQTPAAMQFAVKNLDLSVGNFSLLAPFPINVSAEVEGRIKGAPVRGRVSGQGSASLWKGGSAQLEKAALELGQSSLEMTGSVQNFSDPTADLKITIKPLDSASLAPFVSLPAALAKAQASGELSLKGRKQGLSAEGRLKATSEGLVADMPLTVKAEGLPDNMSIDARLTFSELRLENSPLAPGVFASGAASGGHSASLNVSLKGKPEDLTFSLDADLKPLNVAYQTTFRKPAGTPLTLRSAGSFRNSADLNISSSQLVVGPVTANVRGDIKDVPGAQNMNLSVAASPFAVDGLPALLPMASGYKLSGKAGGTVNLKGPAASPKFQGKATLKGLNATPAAGLTFSSLDGTLEFTDTSAAVDKLAGKFNGSALSLKARVKNFDRPDIWLEGSLDHLDAGALMAAFFSTAPASGTSAAPAAPKPGGPPAESRPASAAPAGKPAGAASPSASAGPPPMARAAGTLRLGSVTHPKYLGRQFKMTFDLTDLGPDMGKANGTADFSAADGKIHNLPLAAKINKFVKKDDVEITYRAISGSFRVTNGVLDTQDFTVDSSQTDILAKGKVALATMVADMRLVVKLPEGALGGFLGESVTGADGRPTLELIARGPLSDPDIKPDVAKAGKQLFQKGLEKGLEKFLKRSDGAGDVRDSTGTEGAAPEEPKKPVDRAVKEGLKDLEDFFRKRR